jgi:hypothetical protein
MPSSVIRSYFYDTTDEVLTIVFISGRRYDYFGVPGVVYRELSSAFSKGEYFNENIRDRYPFRRFGQVA